MELDEERKKKSVYLGGWYLWVSIIYTSKIVWNYVVLWRQYIFSVCSVLNIVSSSLKNSFSNLLPKESEIQYRYVRYSRKFDFHIWRGCKSPLYCTAPCGQTAVFGCSVWCPLGGSWGLIFGKLSLHGEKWLTTSQRKASGPVVLNSSAYVQWAAEPGSS